MHFRKWNSLYFIRISLKSVPKGPIGNNPALVQIMAWRWIGDKPLTEPMLIRFIAYIYEAPGGDELTRHSCSCSVSTSNNKIAALAKHDAISQRVGKLALAQDQQLTTPRELGYKLQHIGETSLSPIAWPSIDESLYYTVIFFPNTP